jgi:hypothetical protein
MHFQTLESAQAESKKIFCARKGLPFFGRMKTIGIDHAN